MIEKGIHGSIINMASMSGSIVNIPQWQASYNASKAALNAFTIHLAAELKDTKIKVNSAHPGWVKTDMGSSAAPMEIPDGAKTSVALALAGDDGPNGRFIHLGKELPW